MYRCDSQVPQHAHQCNSVVIVCAAVACSATLCLLQFLATLTQNTEILTGSPVTMSVVSYTAGSVVVVLKADFDDGSPVGAKTYADTMTSGDPSKVFGTGYGSVYVDPTSVQTSQVSNPARKLPHIMSLHAFQSALTHQTCIHSHCCRTTAW